MAVAMVKEEGCLHLGAGAKAEGRGSLGATECHALLMGRLGSVRVMESRAHALRTKKLGECEPRC